MLGRTTSPFIVFDSPFWITFLITDGESEVPPLIGGKDRSCFDLGGFLGTVELGDEPSEFAKRGEN